MCTHHKLRAIIYFIEHTQRVTTTENSGKKNETKQIIRHMQFEAPRRLLFCNKGKPTMTDFYQFIVSNASMCIQHIHINSRTQTQNMKRCEWIGWTRAALVRQIDNIQIQNVLHQYTNASDSRIAPHIATGILLFSIGGAATAVMVAAVVTIVVFFSLSFFLCYY